VPGHPGVERQRAAEASADVAQDIHVLFARIRIVGGDDAAATQRRESDYGLSDTEETALPRAFREPLDPTDGDVRPQASHVQPRFLDRAVGRDEQRQDVKAL